MGDSIAGLAGAGPGAARAMIADSSLRAAPAASHAREHATCAAVERRERLDVEAFRREYVATRRPVVLPDVATNWPIRGRASPEQLRRRFGACPVRAFGVMRPLAELLDHLFATPVEPPFPAPCRLAIAKELPALLPEIAPRFAHSLPERQGCALIPPALLAHIENLEIVFAAAGARSPHLQCDPMRLHAWIVQLHGAQEIALYAPGQEAFLYPDSQMPWLSVMRNHYAPDPLRHPLFRNAQAQRIVLHAGETLFVPCGWWRGARSLDGSVSVVFDQLGPDNWPDFVADAVTQRRREGKPSRALALGTYLDLVGAALAAAEGCHFDRSKPWCRR